VDRLTDSLAQGYWAAMIGREEDARARYEHVVERSSDGVYEVDPEGRISYANSSFELIVGRRFVELSGRKLVDVFQRADPGQPALDLFGEDRWMRLDIIRPDGVRRILEVHSIPRSSEGEVVGFQGVVRDVTAAAALERDKNEFLKMVTYDLRQPLTTILGLAATIESHSTELPPEQVGRMANQVRRQAERMTRMADDLHDVSQLQGRTLLLAPRPVDLRSAVDAAVVAAGDTGAVEIAVPADVEVMADARRLEQIVANLVENALVHGGLPVKVELLQERDDSGRLVLSITDGGTGVPEALVPTLFSGVRTLSRTTRDRNRGTGLGLSLVSGLAEAMGGRVWYELRDGASSFNLALTPTR
jgi:PAS domain S-box-containing protein